MNPRRLTFAQRCARAESFAEWTAEQPERDRSHIIGILRRPAATSARDAYRDRRNATLREHFHAWREAQAGR